MNNNQCYFAWKISLVNKHKNQEENLEKTMSKDLKIKKNVKIIDFYCDFLNITEEEKLRMIG